MTVSESLEQDLAAWGLGHTALAAAARLVAAQLDAGASERNLSLLTAELRQLMKQLEAQKHRTASELDAFLDRVRAPEYG